MEELPLAGRSYRRAGGSQAAGLAGSILSDLGGRMLDVAAGSGAELADWDGRDERSSVVLSAYGVTGRFADGPVHHSAVEAVAGALTAQYAYEPGPVYLVSPYSTTAQALLAVAGVLAAQVGGRGGGPLPVSALQGLLAIQSGFYSFGAEADPQRFAHSPRGQTPFYSTYRAADGWLFFGGLTTSFMVKVLQATGLEDLLDDPRLHEGPRALRDPELLRQMWERIGVTVEQRPRDHWLALFAGAKVPAGPVLALEEALAHPHIGAAGLSTSDTPIDRLSHSTRVTRVNDAQARVPRPGGPLPLSGLRVVELAGYIAGPYVGRMLTDLGADVVKIEPVDGDPFRSSGYGFAAWNYGKRSISLDLRDTAGRERLLRLVGEADILVTNYRPEALARMGLGREEMFRVNPALTHCTLSAFGETGPLAQLQGFDPVVQAFAGIMKRQGGEDEPVKPQMAATDYLSGMLGAIGVLAARASQMERGGGYIVRTSLLAAALLLNFQAYEAIRAGRGYITGGRDFKGPHPLNGLHEARDGWLLTAAPEADPAGTPDALRYLADGVRGDTVDAAIARLASLGVAAAPCLAPADLLAEPHFVENGLWVTVEEAGLGPVVRPAPVLARAARLEPAPGLGEHNAVEDVWRVAESARI